MWAQLVSADVSMRQVFVDIQNESNGRASDMVASNYVLAAGITLSAANGWMRHYGRKQIYCQPHDLALGLKDYQRIVLAEYRVSKKNIDAIDTAEGSPLAILSFTLLAGLVKEYPCN